MKRFLLSTILALSFIFSLSGGFFSNASGTVHAEAGPAELYPASTEFTDSDNPRLDSTLNRMVRESEARLTWILTAMVENTVPEDRVQVVIECLTDDYSSVLDSVDTLGAFFEAGRENLLQVNVPVLSLTALSANENINLIRIPMEPMYSTVYTSQGVALINADDWQASGFDGTGVKVGVLDGGFDGYEDLRGTELPESVTVMSYRHPYDIFAGTHHGTACAEIVYDVAPGADMYLVNFGTELEYVNAVEWLVEQEVDIITSSVGWPVSGPGDGTGMICEAADAATDAGIFFSISAGNSAERHWQGAWDDTNNNSYLDFVTGTSDICTFSASKYSRIVMALKWDDTWGTSANNYDLELYNPDGQLVAYSSYVQNGDSYPRETLSYSVGEDSGTYYIKIKAVNNPSPFNFHLYSYNHYLSLHVSDGSISVPADADNVTAIGAIRASYWDTTSAIESFSSLGPTKDGRIKPDFSAPDGVDTNSYLTAIPSQSFLGTSAAAPHAGGAAVLVKQAYPAYSREEIERFFKERAVDVGTTGKDNIYGFGKLELGDPVISVRTENASAVTYDAVTMNGNLVSPGIHGSVNVSFIYGTVQGSPDHYTANVSITAPGSFNATVSGLAPCTTYYFTAEASADGETAEGAEFFFTTGVLAPSVTTQSVTDITSTTAVAHGAIVSLGAPDPVQHGFVWNTAGDPTVSDNKTEKGAVNTTGEYMSSLDGLDPYTTYFVRAYATNAAGTVYGSQVSFTTSPVAPSVTTQEVTDITSATAVACGTLVSLGIPGLTQHGFVWSTSPGPDISDFKTLKGSAVGTGTYTGLLSGLSPDTTWYVRAYATNTAGTVYGNEVSFATSIFILRGDADGNGVVNVFDITKAYRIILEMDDETPGADADENGVVNASDLSRIAGIILGLY